MSDDQLERAWAMFDQLADVPPEQRQAALEAACGDERSLHAQVEELLALDAQLAASDGQQAFLQSPLVRPPSTPGSTPGPSRSPRAQSRIPDHIGRYRVLRLLGEGGMAIVYEAEQDNPRRPVALKVIRPGLLSPALVKRFEHEAQILGRLRHPGIAQIYEAGVAEDGQPFFAMEFIRGVALDAYVRLHGLDALARLELLTRVCDAVQYAHEQGIIHRDLKPSNILVDETGQPKVLDFGVARAADGDQRTGAERTRTGQLIGTLNYMSPEQVAANPAVLDRRSDVYTLGVILFQLLVDQLPYPLAELSLPEAAQAIREQEASRLGSVDTRFRGDVETIVAKALEKDKTRRYQSAGELAADIRRYLRNEPIRARPPSALYQLTKFARRHKALVGGVAGVIAALAVGLLGTILFAVRATQLANSEARLRRDAEQLSLRLTLEKAWSLPEQGQVAEGMLWLVRCMEIAPADDADLQQAIRANLAAWYGYLHPLRAQLLHGARIDALAFSPDGKRIATGGVDKTVRIWDTSTGEPIGSPLLHEEAIQAVAFTGDGKRLVVVTVTPLVYTWDATAGKLLREPLRNAAWPDGMRRVFLSPNGSHMLVLGPGATSRLWETESGKAVGALLPLHYARDKANAFSPDGSKVISSSFAPYSQVQVQEALTGRTIGKAMTHPAEVTTAALSRDARWAVLGGQDQTARIWDPEKGNPVSPPLRHRERLLAVACSPDNRSVSTSAADNTVRLWEVPTGRPIGPPLWSAAPGNSMTFSPDSSCIAVAGSDGIARLWRVGRRQPEGEPLHHPLALLAVALSPDGRRAATACWNGTFLEWDLALRRPVGKLLHKDALMGMVVAYSPDGRRILTAGWEDGAAQQWDAVTHQPVGKAVRHQSAIIDAAYSPDGSKIVTASADNTAQLWDAQTSEPLGPPLRHNNLVHAVAFHPDGSRVLTGSFDRTARVWDARTFQPIGPPLLHAAGVSEAVFSPSGTQILTTTNDGIAQLWHAVTGQPIGEPMRHAVTIRRAAFSPDGRRVATASHDGTVRIWDVATRRSLGPPLEHPGAVKAVAFSPDGRRILTGDATGNAWLWDATQPVVEGQLERFKLWVQVSTGQELDADTGRIRSLDFATWDARRHRLAELGGLILSDDQ